MSVLITLRVNGDPKRLEEYATEERMQSIVEQAKSHGLIAHRFYGSEDRQIMVLDEWPDAQSFQSFFEGARDEIGPLMQAVGADEEPEITFWNKLETHDDVGWGA